MWGKAEANPAWPRHISEKYLPEPSQETNELSITVNRQGERGWIFLNGPVDAEAIVDSLYRRISYFTAPNIVLDLTGATFFNELSLTALIVVLREKAQSLTHITIIGLDLWALWRLRHPAYGLRLGPQWKSEMLPKGAVFWRIREYSSDESWEVKKWRK